MFLHIFNQWKYANDMFENIRLSEKFLSFHKVILDEQQFLFYIILLN